MLLGTAALAALGVTAAACGESPPPPDLDDLVSQLDLARSDSQLALDAATTATPRLRPALTTVAAERSDHAQALSDEIARLTGEAATSSTHDDNDEHRAGDRAGRQGRRRRAP